MRRLTIRSPDGRVHSPELLITACEELGLTPVLDQAEHRDSQLAPCDGPTEPGMLVDELIADHVSLRVQLWLTQKGLLDCRVESH